MDFLGLYKRGVIENLENLGFPISEKEKIFTFIDFGNVNYWYEKDMRDGNNQFIPKGKKLIVDIKKLSDFCSIFSQKAKFYYGMNELDKRSIKIISLARDNFGKGNAITKPIQKIKHYLDKKDGEVFNFNSDKNGNYIFINKCNFDVEICLDAIRIIDQYDVFCLFSGDADFACLIDYLKRKGKKTILFSSGYVSHLLKDKADLNINAQNIKKYIALIK